MLPKTPVRRSVVGFYDDVKNKTVPVLNKNKSTDSEIKFRNYITQLD
jgi:hypothetical protein